MPFMCHVRIVLSSILLSITLGVALSGCTNFAQEQIRAPIVKDLLADGDDGAAKVDLDKLVPGEWQRAIVICRGSSKQQAQDALGVAWPEMPNLEDRAFGGVIAFATDSGIENYLQFGQEDFFAEDFFVMCGNPAADLTAYAPPLIIRRSNSVIRFTLQERHGDSGPWYITPDEFSRLRNVQQ